MLNATLVTHGGWEMDIVTRAVDTTLTNVTTTGGTAARSPARRAALTAVGVMDTTAIAPLVTTSVAFKMTQVGTFKPPRVSATTRFRAHLLALASVTSRCSTAVSVAAPTATATPPPSTLGSPMLVARKEGAPQYARGIVAGPAVDPGQTLFTRKTAVPWSE